jgi:hypothetical protein
MVESFLLDRPLPDLRHIADQIDIGSAQAEKLVFTEHFLKYLAVEVVKIENADLTLGGENVIDDVEGLGLADGDFVVPHVVVFNQVGESADRKGVVLGGDA